MNSASTTTKPIIALLTDFGYCDSYVGSMKAIIASICNCLIIDVSHEIQPQDITEAAYVLQCAHRDFPRGTIFVCVVDPGVGSERAPLLVQSPDYCFIGPDNGLLSSVCTAEVESRIFKLNRSEYYNEQVSSTFHGRDIFAACAAHLALIRDPEKLGSELEHQPIELLGLKSHRDQNGEVVGRVIRCDRFGNLQTNIHRSDVHKVDFHGFTFVTLGEQQLPLRSHFEDGKHDQLFCYWGSSGFLEIARYCGSAEKHYGYARNVPVTLPANNQALALTASYVS
jgi:hypothetical protein